MSVKKNKKKKQKHIVGKKEFLFDIISLTIIIGFALYIGFRSIYYYSRETSRKKVERNTLSSSILNNNRVTTEETGLRKSDDGYYFVGNVENNYVKVFNRLYRIIEVTNDNKVKIISDDNEAVMIYGNDNNYKTSNIYNWLNKSEVENTGIYYNSIPNVTELLEETSYCEGTLKNDKVTCPKKKEKAYFSILTVNDYIRALSKKSFLNNGKYSFILGYDENNNPLFIAEDGTINSATNFDGYGIRVVMTLKKNILISSGTGTKTDPYIINQEGNENKINKYVKLGEDLYQIMEEKDNLLKLRKNDYLTLNGIYPEVAFNNKVAEFSINSRYNIGYYLNNTYYRTLTYKDQLLDCEFYIGEISPDTSYSYSEIYKEKVTTKIGLLNIFDLNTNTNLTNYYLLNTTSSVGSMARVYNQTGIIDDDKASEVKKIVPVICIDKNILKGGIGNIDNPYVME